MLGLCCMWDRHSWQRTLRSEGPMHGLMLFCCHLEIPNDFLTFSTFSFCTWLPSHVTHPASLSALILFLRLKHSVYYFLMNTLVLWIMFFMLVSEIGASFVLKLYSSVHYILIWMGECVHILFPSYSITSEIIFEPTFYCTYNCQVNIQKCL